MGSVGGGTLRMEKGQRREQKELQEKGGLHELVLRDVVEAERVSCGECLFLLAFVVAVEVGFTGVSNFLCGGTLVALSSHPDIKLF